MTALPSAVWAGGSVDEWEAWCETVQPGDPCHVPELASMGPAVVTWIADDHVVVEIAGATVSLPWWSVGPVGVECPPSE